VETLITVTFAHFGCSAVDKTLISKIFLMYRKLKLIQKICRLVDLTTAGQPTHILLTPTIISSVAL